MNAEEHYAAGEKNLLEAWSRDAGIEAASLLVSIAQAHFTAALASTSLEKLQYDRRMSALRRRMGPSA